MKPCSSLREKHSRQEEEAKGCQVTEHSQTSLEDNVPGAESSWDRREGNSEVWAKVCGACVSWYHLTFTLGGYSHELSGR